MKGKRAKRDQTDKIQKPPTPAIPIPQQPPTTPHPTDTTHEVQHETISGGSSSFVEDEKMQDDISGHTNPKTFIDEIITRATIATEDDLNCELNASDAISKWKIPGKKVRLKRLADRHSIQRGEGNMCYQTLDQKHKT